MDFLKISQHIIIVLCGIFLARYLILPSIIMHELGHLIAAKIRRIPTYSFTVGSGQKIVSFNFLNMPWTIMRQSTGGAVVVPRLTPVSESGWNSIFYMALSGPAMNIALAAASFIIMCVSDFWLIKLLAVSALLANYHLAKVSEQDYAMAKVARKRDLDSLKSYHMTGEDAPPEMNIG